MKKNRLFLLALLGVSVGATACHDDVSGITIRDLVCKPSEVKCESGSIKRCVGTDWQTVACPNNTCADEKNCALEESMVCTPKDVYCSTDHVKVVRCADDGKSLTETTCAHGQICDASDGAVKCSSPEEVVECNVGAKSCSEDALKIRTCLDNQRWGDFEPCGNDQHCDASKIACVPGSIESACVLGDFECSSDHLSYRRCGERGWSDMTPCEGGHVCNANVKDCVLDEACDEGEVRCSADLKQSEKCSATGAWDVTDCGEDELCDAGECKKTVCTPNVNICIEAGKSTGLYVCTPSGQKGSLIDWCIACNDDHTACADPCEDKETKCSQDLLESFVCKNGLWEKNEFCADTQLCDEGECKNTICQPNVPFCWGTGRSAGMYDCTPSGQRGDNISYCQGFECHDASMCNECTTGSTSCTEEGVFRICINGLWQDMTDCGNKDSCSADPKELGCNCTAASALTPIQPSTRCNDDKSLLQVCGTQTKDGITFKAWETLQDCAGPDLCEDTSKTPYCKCNADGISCNGQTLQICKGGRLTDDQTCSEHEKCDAEAKTCICEEKAIQCSLDGGRDVCSDGKWKSQPCGKSQTCNEQVGAVCVNDNGNICKSDDTACHGNTLVSCVDAIFDAVETCSTFCAYNDKGIAACANKCTPDYQFCSDDYLSIHMCGKDGVTTTDKRCPEGERCIQVSAKEAKCEAKQCDEGTFSCKSNVVMACHHNAWVELADCENSALVCQSGKCVPNAV